MHVKFIKTTEFVFISILYLT